MAKKKVFISFDFDNDKTLKEFIVGQAKNSDSPFEMSDHSLKEAAPELGVAIEKGKTKFQIIGYKGGTSDWAVPNGGCTYSWSWKNLKKLLA